MSRQRKGHLSVALLMESMEDAQEVSQVFRGANVLPHFYETLSDFWRGTLEKGPGLALVDVKMMSEGELVLRDHPAIINNQMPLAFFYSDETAPLLFSTYEILNFGLLKKGSNYRGHIKSILMRVNRMISLEVENQDLGIRKNKYQRQAEGLIHGIEVQKEKDFYLDELKTMVFEVASFIGKMDFSEICQKLLESWSPISEYSLLGLGKDQMKLVSPGPNNSPKFRSIPNVWLGEKAPGEINFYGQNMASQVTQEVMGGNLVQLLVRKERNLVEWVLTLKVNKESYFEKMDWKFLETLLSGMNCQNTLGQMEQIKESEKGRLSNWELMSLVEGVHEKNSKMKAPGKCCIQLDFSNLILFKQKHKDLFFLWKEFYYEFLGRLTWHQKNSALVAEQGVKCLTFMVDELERSKFQQTLTDFLESFPFWRYFENVGGEEKGINPALGADLKPQIMVLPMSEKYFLKALGDVYEFDSMGPNFEFFSFNENSLNN